MPLGLVTFVAERGEEFTCLRRYLWVEGERLAVDLDGCGPDSAQGPDEFLIETPVVSWRWRLIASAANTMVKCASIASR